MINRIKEFGAKWYIPIIGGLLFIILFYYAYSKLNPNYYILRDDGIITMSHAKNLVDYGFIGVGPSGERVEGYSAPVQFFVYAIAHFVSGVGFSVYAKAQTLICTFVLGFIFTLYFSEKKYFAIIAAGITAFFLTQLTSFFQWHGSGMENAITHSLFALTIFILFRFSQERKIVLILAVIPFLASISRLDGIYHVLPLLVIFSAYWVLIEKKYKGVVFLAMSMALWIAYNAWRFFYFGDLNPNTAYAQEISVGERLTALLGLEHSFLNSSSDLSGSIFSAHGGYFLFLAFPFLFFFDWKKSYGLLFLLSTSVMLTAWFNPFLFGPTRLDITRSTTQMAFFVFVAIFCIIYSVKNPKVLLLAPLLIPAALIVHSLNYVPPYYMCCGIGAFDSFRREFSKIAEKESLPRPTVSNPDLGVMSWHKQFNIVDLGMLGSQVMAKLKNGPITAEYFFNYAAPDMIESHEAWSCRYYESIFTDSRFKTNYNPVREKTVRWNRCGNTELPVGIWVRKDILKTSSSPERKFIDDLEKDLSIDRIATELGDCQSQLAEAKACAYVARTAYRFLPELRSSGKIDQVVDIFKSSRTKDFDNFLLTGFKNGKANEKAIAFIGNNFLESGPFSKANLESGSFSKAKGGNGFDIYFNEKYVIYLNDACSKVNTAAPFYVHVIPLSSSELKLNRPGFENLDFKFRSKGFMADNKCMAVRHLPTWGMKSVTTGQWLPKKKSRIWESNLYFQK